MFHGICYGISKKSPEAFTVRTRTACGQIVFVGGTLPRPGCVQMVRNRRCAGRVERASMVCHVLWLRVLERRLRAPSGITVRDPIVCVVPHEVQSCFGIPA